MSFRCIRCDAPIEARYIACPECGEPVTDFLREYLEKPVGGNYQLLKKLGRGGMGEVYKVRHIYFKTDFVIKVMRQQVAADAALTERFIREARIAKKIQHENVAQIHDFSSLPDGSFYMVWEYIDGQNLARIIEERGALSPEYAMQIAVQVLHGLEAIHDAGFVHRDISPDNIMVTKDAQGRDLVKVIDLGIAKQDTESGETMTAMGLFIGKAKYASPEQINPSIAGDRIDARADLYSLGIVMYEMLTGRAPFNASTPHQYIAMHLNELPPLLPETLPSSYALQPLITMALEKDRDRRFRSAKAFAQEIEKAMAARIETDGPAAPVEIEETEEWVQVNSDAPDQSFVPQSEASPAPTPGARTLSVRASARLPKWNKRRGDKSTLLKWGLAVAGLLLVAVATLLAIDGYQLFWMHQVGPSVETTTIDAAPVAIVDLEEWIHPASGVVFRRIPRGSFLMGCVPGDERCYDDETRHRVTLTKDYWLAKTETTLGQYSAFPGASDVARRLLKSDDHPATGLTWDEALAFCTWIGGRLPTEAEWENAARAGEAGTIYPWGNEMRRDYASYEGGAGQDRFDTTSPVGSFKPNRFGLYDMIGNVSEWCADRYGVGLEDEIDPQGPDRGADRVLRGGSYFAGPMISRVSFRNRSRPDYRTDTFGFRCARDVSRN